MKNILSDLLALTFQLIVECERDAACKTSERHTNLCNVFERGACEAAVRSAHAFHYAPAVAAAKKVGCDGAKDPRAEKVSQKVKIHLLEEEKEDFLEDLALLSPEDLYKAGHHPEVRLIEAE